VAIKIDRVVVHELKPGPADSDCLVLDDHK